MPPRAQAVETPGSRPEREPRKPARRDPERRRQQNVQAQKRYRAKLRERLAHLEALTAPTLQDQTIEAAEDITSLSDYRLSVNDTNQAADSMSLNNSSAQFSGDFTIPESSATATEAYEAPTTRWDNMLQIPKLDQFETSLALWDASSHIDPSLLFCDSQKNDQEQCGTTFVKCGCSRSHVQIKTAHPESSVNKNIKIVEFGISSVAADPYINHLRLETVCTIAALYDVGMHLGLTEELLCEDESPSPFFRFSTNSVDQVTAEKLISSVKSTFKTLKPDLRPTSEQITTKHHPYIDLLPFPTLRKNLLCCSSSLDEDEFFNDILVGLLCWGGTGTTKDDRAKSTGHASTGTPWDSRSWEATGWFLEKYWSLLGGEDGELVRQSQWWRNVRGDMEFQSPTEDLP